VLHSVKIDGFLLIKKKNLLSSITGKSKKNGMGHSKK
jgi:hypothetical protein